MVAFRSIATKVVLAAALLSCSCVNPTGPGTLLPFADGVLPDGPLPPSEEISVKRLAGEIDCLEKHIEKYGSVVPRHADVWGQARLMMHRAEFERVMRPDAYNFTPTIQATISTSDQAYLANAFSLQAALAGASGAGTGPDVTTLVSDPKDVIVRDKLVQRATLANYMGPNGLALEPTIIEDQKKRFLDHLHQLRRNNEGDDNADAPGYALNLVRIPISLLPGHCTQVGHGAECTITANPHLPDDLLPNTFRNLVVNDLAGLLTLPLTRVIETTDKNDLKNILETYENAHDEKTRLMAMKTSNNELEQNRLEELKTAGEQIRNATRDIYAKLYSIVSNSTPVSPHHLDQSPISSSQIGITFGAHNIAYLAQQLRKTVQDHLACKDSPYHLDVRTSLITELNAAYTFLSTPSAAHLWQYCTPALVEAVRTQDIEKIVAIQGPFLPTLNA